MEGGLKAAASSGRAPAGTPGGFQKLCFGVGVLNEGVNEEAGGGA